MTNYQLPKTIIINSVNKITDQERKAWDIKINELNSKVDFDCKLINNFYSKTIK